MLKRLTVLLAMLALLGTAPVGVAATFAPAGTSPCMAMMAHDAGHDGPCDSTDPQPGMPACGLFMAGCAVVAFPGPESPVAFPLSAPTVWAVGPLKIGPGRTIEPNLFPPILSV